MVERRRLKNVVIFIQTNSYNLLVLWTNANNEKTRPIYIKFRSDKIE